MEAIFDSNRHSRPISPDIGNPRTLADRLWHLAEQLLEVKDQNEVAHAIESLSSLSQAVEREAEQPLRVRVARPFHPMESAFN